MPASDRPPAAIFDFSGPAATRGWEPVGDRVMGGVSSGRLAAAPGGPGVFEGEVSLANGGGFASVRSPPGRFDLSRADALVLEVRGDGRVYKLGLRTDPLLDGPTWQASFRPAAGRWEAVRLPLGAFRASWRGRPVPGSPPLDLAAVVRLGLLVGDRQAGPFRLEIAAIRAEPAEPDVEGGSP
jgi:monofunctional biosynthetic peptidoglycan transglycosylase